MGTNRRCAASKCSTKRGVTSPGTPPYIGSIVCDTCSNSEQFAPLSASARISRGPMCTCGFRLHAAAVSPKSDLVTQKWSQPVASRFHARKSLTGRRTRCAGRIGAENLGAPRDVVSEGEAIVVRHVLARQVGEDAHRVAFSIDAPQVGIERALHVVRAVVQAMRLLLVAVANDAVHRGLSASSVRNAAPAACHGVA